MNVNAMIVEVYHLQQNRNRIYYSCPVSDIVVDMLKREIAQLDLAIMEMEKTRRLMETKRRKMRLADNKKNR
jgi:hypothetical protein